MLFAEYLQKVSASASGDNLPDLLAANVIDGPNYAQLGLWTDVTATVCALDVASHPPPAQSPPPAPGAKNLPVPPVPYAYPPSAPQGRLVTRRSAP